MQSLNLKHKGDKWYDYGKVALNVGNDIITVSTLGTSLAASTSAKQTILAFLGAVAPNSKKEAVRFGVSQFSQGAGDYWTYNISPTDDVSKTLTGMLPLVGTYYAAIDASSKNTIVGIYSPIE